jgi:hypothetical protein
MKLYFTIIDKENPHKVYFGTTSKSLEKRLEEIKKNDNLQVTDYFNKVGWKRGKGTLIGVENENYTSEEKVKHIRELYKQYKPTLQGNVQQSVFSN